MPHEGLEPAGLVARRLFNAIAAGRWSDAASFIDPSDVEAQYNAAIALKLGGAGNPTFSVDRDAAAQALRTETSELSQSARQALLPRTRLPFPLSVLGEISFDTLRSLSPLELMARTMEIGEAAFLDEHGGRQPAFESEDKPAPAGRHAKLLRVVLGEAQESDVVAHVVFRRVLQELDAAYLIEPIGCVTFRKLSIGWRVVLSRLSGSKPRIHAAPWRTLFELRHAWL